MSKKFRGFTLIELMVVVAIIAVLASIAIPAIYRYRIDAYRTQCIGNLKQILNAVESTRTANHGKVVDFDLGQSPYTRSDGQGYFQEVPRCPYSQDTYVLDENRINIDAGQWYPTCVNSTEPHLHLFNPDHH